MSGGGFATFEKGTGMRSTRHSGSRAATIAAMAMVLPGIIAAAPGTNGGLDGDTADRSSTRSVGGAVGTGGSDTGDVTGGNDTGDGKAGEAKGGRGNTGDGTGSTGDSTGNSVGVTGSDPSGNGNGSAGSGSGTGGTGETDDVTGAGEEAGEDTAAAVGAGNGRASGGSGGGTSTPRASEGTDGDTLDEPPVAAPAEFDVRSFEQRNSAGRWTPGSVKFGPEDWIQFRVEVEVASEGVVEIPIELDALAPSGGAGFSGAYCLQAENGCNPQSPIISVDGVVTLVLTSPGTAGQAIVFEFSAQLAAGFAAVNGAPIHAALGQGKGRRELPVLRRPDGSSTTEDPDTGGSDTGGSDTDGSDTDGAGTGGSGTDGTDTGGSDTGGAGTGGSDTGDAGTGGSDTGGAGTDGTSTVGAGPADGTGTSDPGASESDATEADSGGTAGTPPTSTTPQVCQGHLTVEVLDAGTGQRVPASVEIATEVHDLAQGVLGPVMMDCADVEVSLRSFPQGYEETPEELFEGFRTARIARRSRAVTISHGTDALVQFFLDKTTSTTPPPRTSPPTTTQQPVAPAAPVGPVGPSAPVPFLPPVAPSGTLVPNTPDGHVPPSDGEMDTSNGGETRDGETPSQPAPEPIQGTVMPGAPPVAPAPPVDASPSGVEAPASLTPVALGGPEPTLPVTGGGAALLGPMLLGAGLRIRRFSRR